MRTALALLAVSLCFTPLCVDAQVPVSQGPSTPDLLWEKTTAGITAIAARLDGVMGVSIVDLTDGRSFVLHADQLFPAASTIKLPLLLELYRQEQDGRAGVPGLARLLDRYTFDRADLVDDSRIMAGLTPNISVLTNRDLAQCMVAVSDNAATNVLIRRVGMERVNAMLRAQGLVQTMLRRRMIDIAAARRGDENIATPQEFTRLLEAIWKGKILNAELTQAYLEQLSTTKPSHIPRLLPSGVRVANKSGELDGVRADVGIVYAAHRPFAMSVMTAMNRDDQAAEVAIGEVALAAYRYFAMVGTTSVYGRIMP